MKHEVFHRNETRVFLKIVETGVCDITPFSRFNVLTNETKIVTVLSAPFTDIHIRQVWCTHVQTNKTSNHQFP